MHEHGSGVRRRRTRLRIEKEKRMTDQIALAELFRSLHVPGRPLLLFNVWDAGSAKAVAAGAAAIATGSWSVAAAHGYDDGETLPLDLVLANAERIVRAVDLPVTIDFESGYGEDAAAVGRSFERLLGTGAIGCNLEDSDPADGQVRPVVEASARCAAARAAAGRTGVPAFINARTDLFLQAPGDAHDAALVDAALERARAYADAGADGLFVPGLTDERLIERVVTGSPLPVNIMMSPGKPPAARLAELGVARISHGPGPYRSAMAHVEEAARAAATS
jgi:2-methylisocitrate lyase-like PEP mutase family enzyme